MRHLHIRYAWFAWLLSLLSASTVTAQAADPAPAVAPPGAAATPATSPEATPAPEASCGDSGPSEESGNDACDADCGDSTERDKAGGVRACEHPPHPQGNQLQWDPSWRKFNNGDALLLGMSMAVGIGKFGVGSRDQKNYGGWWVDEDVRNALRVNSSNGRRVMRDVSDVLLTVMETYPFFQSLVVASWYRDSPEVGAQMALISAEVMALTFAVQGIANVAVSRERPYGRECGGELPHDLADCDTPDRYFSHFSGHSSQSFASAAVACTHHIRFPLYGGGVPDGAACVAGFAVATTVATLRVAGDMHYFTDVLIGAGVGTLIGFGLPWLLHYRDHAPLPLDEPDPDAPIDHEQDRAVIQNFLMMPTPTGVMTRGEF